MVRAAAALFCAVVGLGAGYSVWGERASALATSLDQLTFEYDALRESFSTSSGAPAHSFASALESLSGQVREQGQALAEQTQALVRLVGDRDTQAQESACDEVEVNLQQQLETCLFTRAKLEREAAMAKQAAQPRPPGKQTFTESVEVPSVPPNLKKRFPAPQKDDSDEESPRSPSPGGQGLNSGERSGLEASAGSTGEKPADSDR